MIRSVALILCSALAAGAQVPPTGNTGPDSARQRFVSADSLVLVRLAYCAVSACYRLTVTSSGVVRYQSISSNDSTRGRDSVSRDVFLALIDRAERSGFLTLPDTIGTDRGLCGVTVSPGHAVATLTIFGRPATKSVVDDLGCQGLQSPARNAALDALRRLERAVDSTLGSARWTRR
jgi:hypothetical protein